jgi:plasmid replication initiation protein
MSKSVELHKNKDVTLAQANALTQARYDFSVVEKRAVYFIIQEVRRQFIDRIDGQKNLFDNLIVRIKTVGLTNADMELRDVYDALVRLRKKSIYIKNAEHVLEVGFINYFHHQCREPYLEVEVSHKILPYLVELASHFTTYSLTVAIALRGKYSQRFYEYCSQFELSDADPKNAFDIGKHLSTRLRVKPDEEYEYHEFETEGIEADGTYPLDSMAFPAEAFLSYEPLDLEPV